MTFSLVGRDGAALGVAVASKFLAVGAYVPGAAPGAGAVATQAAVNLRWAPEGVGLMQSGRTAAQALTALVAADAAPTTRQGGLVDAAGTSAAHTGADCIPWAGHEHGDGFSAQGNCLAGPEVVAGMVAAWHAGSALPIARRLLAGLQAGDAAGGDKRGRQSAALLVVAPGAGYDGGNDVLVDLRVDDHPDPVGELARLLDLHDLYFGKPDPATLLPLAGDLLAEVDGLVAATGFASLREWAGWENYEERLVDGAIDPLVLDRLRATA